MNILNFKNKIEIRRWVFNNVAQEDGRYLNIPEDIDSLIEFIDNDGIIIEEREIPIINEPSKEELDKIPEPQAYHKYIALKLLELNNLNKEKIKFEYPYKNRKVDVYFNDDNKTILIECGSCYLRKPIEYLEQQNIEVWIITNGLGPWEKTPIKDFRSSWFILKRGKDWETCYKIYKENLMKEILKIKNPFDDI